jgi:soluble lytic murein transglycosylase-like protein
MPLVARPTPTTAQIPLPTGFARPAISAQSVSRAAASGGAASGTPLLPAPSLLTPTALAFANGHLQPQMNGLADRPLPYPAGRLTFAGKPNGANAGPPGQQCRRAIANAERLAGIPEHLLSSIARIESGRRDPQTGLVDPWPWSINVEGVDHIYETEPEVIAAVQMFQSQGHRSIDVGCIQVNLMYHPDAFATLEQAFDPKGNADYGAKFLTELYKQTGSWERATAYYHSATPELGEPYERKVIAALPEEQKQASGGSLAGMQRMAALTMPSPAMLFSPSPISQGPISPGSSALGMSHVMPMPGFGGTMMTGRTLDSYRNNPVTLARR